MSNLILTHLQDGIWKIGINRPEKKNALTFDMYRALTDALLEGDQRKDVRVLMLHGTNDCFTAGNDIADFAQASRGDTQGTKETFRFLNSLNQVKKPLIGVVSGLAIGIGTTALLSCDLVYAGASARFQLPFVDLGLCPEAGSSLLLPRLIGHPRAMELFLLCEPFGAQRALELGIVNRVFDDASLMENAIAIAKKISAKPAASVALTKALLRRADDSGLKSILDEECAQIAKRIQSPEAAEAFQAFLEKRKPDFSRFT